MEQTNAISFNGDVSQSLDIIDRAFESGQGYEIIHNILQVKKVVGIALAKALYLGEHYWTNSDETFRDFAVTQYGIRAENVKRYIDTWELILKTPEEMRGSFLRKPMQELIPLATNVANGELEETEIEWDRFLLASGNGEVYNIIREATGKESTDRLRIYIDPKTGDIESWSGDTRELIGYLDVSRMDVEQVRKSINRIINRSKIREKNNA